MRRLVDRGLEQTAPMWEEIRLAYHWVHRAACILANEEKLLVEELRRRYRGLLSEMSRRREETGTLSSAVSLFLKVTKSYWKGLFACYRVPDLPRTNNDLEHCFGSARYHERRASGRKGASPAMVVRGSCACSPPWSRLRKGSTQRAYARWTSKVGERCVAR